MKGNNPKLKINLKEMFGVDVSDSDSLKQKLGQALMDQMIERTKSGKSVTGKPFRAHRGSKTNPSKGKYSKQYVDSPEFRAAGKSKGKINLTLTGDMLGLMDIDNDDKNKNSVVIGWDDSDEAAKAHGHITGSKKGPKVKRDFFGLTKNDIAAVKKQFESEFKKINKATDGDERDEAILGLIEKADDIGVGEV